MDVTSSFTGSPLGHPLCKILDNDDDDSDAFDSDIRATGTSEYNARLIECANQCRLHGRVRALYKACIVFTHVNVPNNNGVGAITNRAPISALTRFLQGMKTVQELPCSIRRIGMSFTSILVAPSPLREPGYTGYDNIVP